MPEQIFFMAGLPRSGSTLLSTLLNQNPDVNSAPQSFLIHAMGHTYNLYGILENKDVPRNDEIANMLDALPIAYYKDYKEKYVINKHFRWTDPIPFMMLEHHLKNPIKIICPVRNVMEILASWNKLANKDINNSRDIAVNQNVTGTLPLPDKRAVYWMEAEHSDIRASLQGMQRALDPAYAHMFHFVEYDDLVSKPQEVLDGIYDFLGIERFTHNFTGIKSEYTFNDVFGLKNHHEIRPTISKESDKPEDVFLPDIIKRYSGLEFWRQDKAPSTPENPV